MIKKLLELYAVFFKIGITTFGGGYAMLPIIEREIVEKKGYATSEEIMDYYAIGQCTPGVIAVNTATLVGNKLCGVWGGVMATLGVVSPAIIIITIISGLINNFASNPYVISALAGIRVAVCALMINVILKLLKTSIKDKFGAVIFIAVLLVGIFTDLSPVYFVVLSALCGILYKRKAGDK